MQPVHIMPCLDIQNGRVVKGVKFVDLKDAADPVEAALAYQAGGADELAFLDITATVEKRVPIYDVLKTVTSAVTLPVTAGGGFKTLADLARAFESGAAAASIASAAYRDPEFIREAAHTFGGGKIVVAIDTDVNPALPSGREVIIDGGRTRTGADVVEFGKKMAGLGVGSLLVTSKTADGARTGYEVGEIRRLVDATGLRVIASGGAGKLEHFLAAAREGGASVLLAASVFHFGTFTIRQVKEYLRSQGIAVVL